MLKLRRTFVLLFAALFCAPLAHAQSLVHAYTFSGNLHDSVGSATLTASNSSGVTGTGSLTTTSGYYTFSAGQGLQFVGETSLRTDYTIALRFSFETVSAYRRIINFENTSDLGQYSLNGVFNFYAGLGSGGTITANNSVDFIITRSSATGYVSAYQGTTLLYSFLDTGNNGTGSNIANQSTFWFFRDNDSENSAGRIDSLVIYNGALTSTQISSGMVTSALTAIPEPATVAIWMGAAGLVGAVVWRRRQRRE